MNDKQKYNYVIEMDGEVLETGQVEERTDLSAEMQIMGIAMDHKKFYEATQCDVVPYEEYNEETINHDPIRSLTWGTSRIHIRNLTSHPMHELWMK